MNSAHETQFRCYIFFIKKLTGLVNSVRDPGLDANASRVCYPNSHLIFVKSVGLGVCRKPAKPDPTHPYFNICLKYIIYIIIFLKKLAVEHFLGSYYHV